MALTRYAEIAARTGLLVNVPSLDAKRKTEAETYAMRHVQGWLQTHLDDADGYGAIRTPKERLDLLETWWEASSIDPLIVDFARAAGELRYLETQGRFDGKTGSVGFHARKYALQSLWDFERRLFEKALLGLDASETSYLVVRRFAMC